MVEIILEIKCDVINYNVEWRLLFFYRVKDEMFYVVKTASFPFWNSY